MNAKIVIIFYNMQKKTKFFFIFCSKPYIFYFLNIFIIQLTSFFALP